MASQSQHNASTPSRHRKNATQQIDFDPAAGPARGILRQPANEGIHHHARRSPAPALQPWIQHYWLVAWSLPPGITQTVQTIPHPNIHLVFSGEGVHIHGIHPRLFHKTLSGHDSVFGVKFRAGGFRPFYNRPLSHLRGRTIPAQSIFGPQIDNLLSSGATEEEKLAAANTFFMSLLPTLSQPNQDAIHAVKACEESPAIRSVAHLAAHMNCSERQLQRLFCDHIGATPKWVILRYRIHELLERINALPPHQNIDWASTALDLGYFDQSHMIRDFRSITGQQPGLYRRQF